MVVSELDIMPFLMPSKANVAMDSDLFFFFFIVSC